MIRHIVLFRFVDSVSASQANEISAKFEEMARKVSAVVGFEMGENNSPEGIARGFTHGYILSFEDDEGRLEYLQHDEHRAFQLYVQDLIEPPLAFDFTI